MPRIQIRCNQDTRSKWKQAIGLFDMDYGPFAKAAARFVMENEDEFRRFLHGEERKREDAN